MKDMKSPLPRIHIVTAVNDQIKLVQRDIKDRVNDRRELLYELRSLRSELKALKKQKADLRARGITEKKLK